MASNNTGQSANSAIDIFDDSTSEEDTSIIDTPRIATKRQRQRRDMIPDAGDKFLPDEIGSNPRSGGTTGGKLLPDEIGSNQHAEGQLIAYLQSHGIKLRSGDISSFLANAKKQNGGWNTDHAIGLNMDGNNVADTSIDESSDDDDDDQGHGFVKKDLVLSSVPFMGQDLEVVAFFDNN